MPGTVPTDPAAPFPLEQDGRTASTFAELARRLALLERMARVTIGSGAPATDPTTVREGTPYIDRTNNRLYFVVAGVWRYTALT